NKEYDRERVLVSKEIKKVWFCLESDDYGKIVKLLTLTLQRLSEIARLERTEINGVEKQLELPGSGTKNGRPHIVQLSPPAHALLKSVDGDGRFMFAKRNNWQIDK